MRKEISHIYLGLPDDLKASCFWVEREYRINDLSFLSGGSDIVVQYADGTVFGYDCIKYPSKYIYRIILNKYDKAHLDFSIDESVTELRQLVQRIFARKNNKINEDNTLFKEVWNNASAHLPWEKLEEFTSDIYRSFLEYFKNNLPLISKYLSIWYPFSYSEVLVYWDLLEKGSAHYSVFLSDVDTIYPSTLGLCYNENIRWNSKLRSKWDYGFDNPYEGYVEGTGNENEEFDEKDYLDTIIPLNINKELEILNKCIFNHWCSSEATSLIEPDFVDIERTNRHFEFLKLSILKDIIETEKITFFSNKSIWDNTMSKMIDRDFCAEIFSDLKNRRHKIAANIDLAL